MAPSTAGLRLSANRQWLRSPAKFSRLDQALCHNIPHTGRRIYKREQVRIMTPRTTKSVGKNKNSDEIVIPDKLYFRIGEVATLCRLPAYVLRFWESEFPQLKPVKSSTGQRMYRRRDVESVLRIKQLLYEDGFTIAGARMQLREETKSERNQTALPFPMKPAVSVAHLRHELQQILHILSARH